LQQSTVSREVKTVAGPWLYKPDPLRSRRTSPSSGNILSNSAINRNLLNTQLHVLQVGTTIASSSGVTGIKSRSTHRLSCVRVFLIFSLPQDKCGLRSKIQSRPRFLPHPLQFIIH
jgi:hypothetical protein